MTNFLLLRAREREIAYGTGLARICIHHGALSLVLLDPGVFLHHFTILHKSRIVDYTG